MRKDAKGASRETEQGHEKAYNEKTGRRRLNDKSNIMGPPSNTDTKARASKAEPKKVRAFYLQHRLPILIVFFIDCQGSRLSTWWGKIDHHSCQHPTRNKIVQRSCTTSSKFSLLINRSNSLSKRRLRSGEALQQK